MARREAFTRPRIPREFLERYDGSPLPSGAIGRNVLETMGVPGGKTEQALVVIVEGADALGLTTTINGRKLVNLRGSRLRVVAGASSAEPEDEPEEDDLPLASAATTNELEVVEPPLAVIGQQPSQNRRVFISHGSNKKIVAQVKELLQFGDFEPVVSVENETTAKPVSAKVLEDMRSCGAGVIHVGDERTIIDAEGNEHHLLNENVLTEIGAALALWEDNFVLLVEDGMKLPSNQC